MLDDVDCSFVHLLPCSGIRFLQTIADKWVLLLRTSISITAISLTLLCSNIAQFSVSMAQTEEDFMTDGKKTNMIESPNAIQLKCSHASFSLTGTKTTEDRDEKFSRDFCKSLALKVKHTSDYPLECHDYEDAMILLRRHNSKGKEDAYAGMSPGDRIDAMRAKDEGHLSGAQIKRRMTTRNKGHWF